MGLNHQTKVIYFLDKKDFQDTSKHGKTKVAQISGAISANCQVFFVSGLKLQENTSHWKRCMTCLVQHEAAGKYE